MKFVYDRWINDTPLPNGWPLALITAIQHEYEKNPDVPVVSICQKVNNNRGSIFNPFHYTFHWTRYGYEQISKDQVVDDNELYVYVLDGYVYEFFDVEETGYDLFESMTPEMANLIRLGKVKLVLNYSHDPREHDDPRMTDYFLRRNINPSNVFFWTGCSPTVIHPNSICYVSVIDRFLSDCSNEADNNAYNHLGYTNSWVDISDLDDGVIRKHKIISMNRTNRPHRNLLMYLAVKNDWIEGNLFSFLLNDMDCLPGGFEYDDSIINVCKKLIPIELDTQYISRDALTSFSTNTNKKQFYLDSYVNIVTETKITGEVFFSEKVFRPILNYQPFIYIGAPGSLRVLRNFGFKTFSDFLDESYDEERPLADRMLIIEREINRIVNMDISELHKLYYDMKDILIHNRNHMKTFTTHNPFVEVENKMREYYGI